MYKLKNNVFLKNSFSLYLNKVLFFLFLIWFQSSTSQEVTESIINDTIVKKSHFKDGSIIVERSMNGKLNGPFIYYYKPNVIAKKGVYVNNIIVGNYKEYYEDGKTRIDFFYDTNGKEHNVQKWYDRKGKLEYLLHYKNGVKEGLFLRYKNGFIKEKSSYKSNKMHGISKKYYKGKLEYQCHYINGKKVGKFKKFDRKNQQLIEKGSYDINQKKDGKYEKFSNTGIELESGNYKNGKKIGVWKIHELTYNKKESILKKVFKYTDTYTKCEEREYNDDGKKYCVKNITNYFEEKVQAHYLTTKNGSYKSFYFCDKIKERGTYKNGKKIGIWEKFNEEGQKTKHCLINNNGTAECDIYEYYWKNSGSKKKLHFTEHYINNKKEGQYIFYYDNGNLKESGEYKNNKQNGPIKYYRENGILKEVSTYKKGKIITTVIYNTNGEIEKLKTY